LLLVMIIMEVLRTVLSYLQERATSLQPFLFIATQELRNPRVAGAQLQHALSASIDATFGQLAKGQTNFRLAFD
jgi:hypothetical protein